MSSTPRRIAAIVLNNLACDLARSRHAPPAASSPGPPPPLGVVIERASSSHKPAATEEPSKQLAAVDATAWHYGLRPGQTIAEAMAFLSHIDIASVDESELQQARGVVAESVLAFGTTSAVSLQLPSSSPSRENSRTPALPNHDYPAGAGSGPYDTVWLDVSGCSHLFGGEELLCAELRACANTLGHEARVAIASGPRLAQTFARWGEAESVIRQEETLPRLHALPIGAFAMSPELLLWFSKLGLLRISDLATLDPSQLAPRISQQKNLRHNEHQDLLALLRGEDPIPLIPYQAPRSICVRHGFDDPIDERQPLLFVLGGLVNRTATRLQLRGEACSRIELELNYDTSVIQLRARDLITAKQVSLLPKLANTETLCIDAPVALFHEADLLRPIRAKIENHSLLAPLRSIELRLRQLSPRPNTQLDIAQHGSPASNNHPNALPTLLAELEAQLGKGRVGLLRCIDSLRPESRSQLRSHKFDKSSLPLVDQLETLPSPLRRLQEPTRVLRPPIALGKVATGSIVSIPHHAIPSSAGKYRANAHKSTVGQHLFIVDHLRFNSRLERVEWWTSQPVSRDYVRARLRRKDSKKTSPHQHNNEDEFVEAWLYVDRNNGQSYLHGWFD